MERENYEARADMRTHQPLINLHSVFFLFFSCFIFVLFLIEPDLLSNREPLNGCHVGTRIKSSHSAHSANLMFDHQIRNTNSLFHPRLPRLFGTQLCLYRAEKKKIIKCGRDTSSVQSPWPVCVSGNKAEGLLATVSPLHWGKIDGRSAARDGCVMEGMECEGRGGEETEGSPQMLPPVSPLILSPPFVHSVGAVFWGWGGAGRQSVMSCQQCSNGSLTYFRKYHRISIFNCAEQHVSSHVPGGPEHS